MDMENLPYQILFKHQNHNNHTKVIGKTIKCKALVSTYIRTVMYTLVNGMKTNMKERVRCSLAMVHFMMDNGKIIKYKEMEYLKIV